MRRLLIVILFLALLGASFWAGSWFKQRETGKGKLTNLTSNINLNTNPTTNTDTDTATHTVGAVRITPEKQQAIGVRVGTVEKKPFNHILRVLGRVSADETLIYRMILASEGWIREVFPFTVGSPVKKGQSLASCYSRELVTIGQTYLNALALLERFPDSGKTELPGQHILPRATSPKVALKLAEDGLRSLGMGDAQIEEMKRTGQLVQYVTLVSPVTGYVLSRNVSPGQWFDRGAELYRIADLSRVWIFADLYGREAQYVRAGMKLKVSIADQEKVFQARVSDVLPQFDPATRTTKLRLEASNPGYIMRPDMFVDVELPVNLPAAITVPADAVLDSGLKKSVFIDLGNGFFEPREVETGWRFGNRVEIVRGLKPGEKIVISGNFLIDSESRLEMAAAGMQGTLSKDLVCGVDVSINKAEKAGRKSTYQGKIYYFSSDECKQKFEKNPGVYVKE